MGKSSKSGLGIGIGSSHQISISQNNYNIKINELFKNEPKPFDSSHFNYKESEQKYDGYLFNINHIVGGPKAKFLKDVLGFEKGDGKKLHDSVSRAIDGKVPDIVNNTIYGTKYSFNIKLEGKNNNYHSANVITVIQNDNGKTTWRLITIIPGKKDK